MRTFLMMAVMLTVTWTSAAQDAPAPSAPPTAVQGEVVSGAPPIASVVVDDQQAKFAVALAEAQRLLNVGEYEQAYKQYFVLVQKHQGDPDVLWGLGQSGAIAALNTTDPVQRRERLVITRAAYFRYANVERRPQYVNGAQSNVQLAREMVPDLTKELEKIVIPEPAPKPAVAATAAPAPPPKPVAAAAPPEIPQRMTQSGFAIQETGDMTTSPRRPRSKPPSDATAASDSAGKSAHASADSSGRPSVIPDEVPEAAETTASPEEHLACLASRGIVTAQFVSEGGRFVIRLRPPSNWENIPCSVAK